MKRVVLSTISLTLASYAALAQTSVIVNPDGTHSTAHSHGESTAIVVNPDGTHSSLHDHGAVSVLVKPDGTHSIIPNHCDGSIFMKQNKKYTRSERKSKKRKRPQ